MTWVNKCPGKSSPSAKLASPIRQLAFSFFPVIAVTLDNLGAITAVLHEKIPIRLFFQPVVARLRAGACEH